MASFLNLFTITDTDGASAARYRLHFLGSPYTHQDSWAFGMLADGSFAVYKVLAVPANALLGLVLSSESWLSPLSQAYQRFTAPLYAVFPPWSLACLGLAIVGVAVLMSRPASTKGDLFSSEALNRLGTALAMVVLVMILTHDPFALINQVLELANGFSVGLAARVTHSASDTTLTTGQALVDQSIRTPAIALNYGREFSADCKELWSQAMSSGQPLSPDSGCFVAGQDKAEPDTVITSCVMWFLPALPMLAFSVIAAWKYVLHLSMSVLCVVATAWVAAGKVHHRRGFDAVSRTVAYAAAHLVLALITSMVAVALPATCSGLAMQILGLVDNPEERAFALMLSLGVGFAASTYVIARVTSSKGALVRVLHADASMTLEATLGMKPRKLSYKDFGIYRFNPFSSSPDVEFATGGKARAGSPSKLAADPSEVTSAPSTIAAGGARLSKGAGSVNDASSTANPNAVKQLSEAAASVSAQANEPAPPAVAVTSTVDATNPPANRMWQWEPDPSAPSTGADAYGYFVAPVAVSAPAHEAGVSAGKSDSAGSRANGDASTSTGPRDRAAADRSSAVSASATVGPLSGPSNLSATMAGTSPLAAARALVSDSTSTQLITPVSGNVYADPVLDTVARAAGATFVAVGPPPVTRTPVHSPLRSFTGTDPATPTPLAVPEVQHGPVLHITEGADIHSGPDHSGGGEVLTGEVINDQQRWNRRGWRTQRRLEPEAVTSSPVPDSAPPSGIWPGANRHPGSFCAPMSDFLAAEELKTQIEEFAIALAASGRRMAIELDPSDRRIAVRLSSDPDQRVVPVIGTGFGDPV